MKYGALFSRLYIVTDAMALLTLQSQQEAK